MKFRKLRIAFSVSCAIACVLLILLWVRSYWWVDSAYFQFRQMPTIGFLSGQGRAILGVEEPGTAGTQAGIESDSIGRETSILDELPIPITAGRLGFNAKSYATGWAILSPMYFLVLLSATLAAVPWIRWKRRFTLRALLIATTLVAVVLGVAVYVARQ